MRSTGEDASPVIPGLLCCNFCLELEFSCLRHPKASFKKAHKPRKNESGKIRGAEASTLLPNQPDMDPDPLSASTQIDVERS